MSSILSQAAPLHSKVPQKTYIVTHDLAEQVQLFKSLKLEVPPTTDPIFTQIKEGFLQFFRNAFPGAKIRSINMSDLSREIWDAASKKVSTQRTITISTCFEIALTRRGHTLEVNRIVDSSGKIIGLGPRPGYPSIAEQLDSIAAIADRSPLIIMEDGSFSGETLATIVKKMQKRNIRVSAIVIGFSFPGAIERIREVFDGEIIVIEQMNEPLDWIPDHDFFPFIPNCGRVLGAPFNGECLPFYSFEGASYSIPYIAPFGDPLSWACIPEDKVWSVSHFCICRMIDLFKEMNRLNGRSLLVGDIAYTLPRVSLPFSIKEKKLLRLDTDVVAFLEGFRSSRKY